GRPQRVRSPATFRRDGDGQSRVDGRRAHGTGRRQQHQTGHGQTRTERGWPPHRGTEGGRLEFAHVGQAFFLVYTISKTLALRPRARSYISKLSRAADS